MGLDTDHDGGAAQFRSGFVCFVGRPNTGKSTLTNALVGQKIAITSNRPQTTRHVVRGIVHRPDAQLVVVDTPGLHRPRTLLGERLNDLVHETYAEVDLIGFCVPAGEKIGPGDRWILEQVRRSAPRTEILGIVTKIDAVGKAQVAEQLVALSQLLGPEADVVPVSAQSGEQIEVLVQVLTAKMEPGPAFYPDGEITDEPETTLMSELIREAALEGVREELPHSLAVVIEEIVEPGETAGASGAGAEDLLEVYAVMYVERESQKGIVIGRGGTRLRNVRRNARKQIEALLGTPIRLHLHVKVAKDWQRDPKKLSRLGF